MKTNVPNLTCLRCDHNWVPRQAEIRICPHCKSAYWDVPRKDISQDPHRSILVGDSAILSGVVASGQVMWGGLALSGNPASGVMLSGGYVFAPTLQS